MECSLSNTWKTVIGHHSRRPLFFCLSLALCHPESSIAQVIDSLVSNITLSDDSTGPVTYPLAARFPRQRRAFMWFGAACVFTSLLGASYAKTVCLSLYCHLLC